MKKYKIIFEDIFSFAIAERTTENKKYSTIKTINQ